MFYGVRILERVRAKGRGAWETGCEARKVKSDASWKRLVFDRVSKAPVRGLKASRNAG